MSHRAGRTLVALMVVAAALGGAACGGDDDDDSAQGETAKTEATGPLLTAEELKTQANALCQEYKQRTEDLAIAFARQEGSGMQPTVGETREYVTKSLPEYERLLSELEGLRPPADIASTYADLIDVGRRAIVEAEKIKQDNKRLLSRDYGDAFLPFNRGAHYLGFDLCVAE